MKALDQGYCNLIETWGSDERIIESARMSTDGAFRGWGPTQCKYCEGRGHIPTGNSSITNQCIKCAGSGRVPGDEKLLRRLYFDQHMSPFEMAGATFEIQAPIMVFREWHRHRTQSYNELSARYTELPNMFYMPDADRLKVAKQAKKNKQGSEAGFDDLDVATIQASLQAVYSYTRGIYDQMLKDGVSREVARLVIPVAQYSRMRASANLRNWCSFLSLRLDVAAQHEIRMFAEAVASLLRERFPRTLELFDEERNS